MMMRRRKRRDAKRGTNLDDEEAKTVLGKSFPEEKKIVLGRYRSNKTE